MSELPEDVAMLLRERIESFEQLESLLLLHRESEHSWTAQAVANALSIAAPMAAEALAHLCRGNLLDVRVEHADKDERIFRYVPATPVLGRSVKELARVYLERRVEVMQAMSTNAVQRMRTSTIRMFADAFLVGRSKKDG